MVDRLDVGFAVICSSPPTSWGPSFASWARSVVDDLFLHRLSEEAPRTSNWPVIGPNEMADPTGYELVIQASLGEQRLLDAPCDRANWHALLEEFAGGRVSRLHLVLSRPRVQSVTTGQRRFADLEIEVGKPSGGATLRVEMVSMNVADPAAALLELSQLFILAARFSKPLFGFLGPDFDGVTVDAEREPASFRARVEGELWAVVLPADVLSEPRLSVLPSPAIAQEMEPERLWYLQADGALEKSGPESAAALARYLEPIVHVQPVKKGLTIADLHGLET